MEKIKLNAMYANYIMALQILDALMPKSLPRLLKTFLAVCITCALEVKLTSQESFPSVPGFPHSK